MRDKKNYTSYRIGVKNFGPLKEAEIDLRPLTIFVGKSNTGKSYLAILIYALLHSLESAPLIPTPLKTWLSFSSRYRFLEEGEKEDDKGKALLKKLMNSLENQSVPILFSEFPDEVRKIVEYWGSESGEFSQNLSDQLMGAFDVPGVAELARSSSNPGGLEIFITAEKNKNFLWNMKAKGKSRSFSNKMHIGNFSVDVIDRKRDPHASHFRFRAGMVDLFCGRTHAIHYLPAARSGIMQAHRTLVQAMIAHAGRAGLGRQIRLPTLPSGIVDFLQRIISYSDTRPRMLFNPYSDRKMNNVSIRDLALKMEEEVLRGSIKHRKNKALDYPSFYYTFKRRTGGSPKEIDLHLASSMVSELTPIVLYLKRYVSPGDILIIEEPEAHLHPEGQKELTKTFARLVRAGVYLIITTHSEWLKEAIDGHIFDSLSKKQKNFSKDTALSKKDVGMWLFERTSSRGSTVREIEFDEEFGFPQDEYEDVAAELYNHFTEIQNEQAEEEE